MIQARPSGAGLFLCAGVGLQCARHFSPIGIRAISDIVIVPRDPPERAVRVPVARFSRRTNLSSFSPRVLDSLFRSPGLNVPASCHTNKPPGLGAPHGLRIRCSRHTNRPFGRIAWHIRSSQHCAREKLTRVYSRPMMAAPYPSPPQKTRPPQSLSRLRRSICHGFLLTVAGSPDRSSPPGNRRSPRRIAPSRGIRTPSSGSPGCPRRR